MSVCLFPTVPWYWIPKSWIYGIFPENGGYAWKICQAVVLFFHCNIGVRMYFNFSTINIVVNLIISTYCIGSAMVHFQRYISLQYFKYGGKIIDIF